MSELAYLISGIIMILISFFDLNIILRKESSDTLNPMVLESYKISIMLLFAMLFTWIAGVYYWITYSLLGKFLMELSSYILAVVLVISTISRFRVYIKEGMFKFRITKDFIDVLMYFAVLWIISIHFSKLSYPILAILSTLTSVLSIYFVFLLGKYYRFRSYFVVPLDLYGFYLSLSLSTACLGMLFFARFFYVQSYLLFADLIYILLIYGIAKIGIELKRHFSMMS